jgi:hypothetical protein
MPPKSIIAIFFTSLNNKCYASSISKAKGEFKKPLVLYPSPSMGEGRVRVIFILSLS